jgi:hypothetical protein
MNADHLMPKDRNAFLENLAAELTNAAYPILLRHGVGEKWLELELDLWKALSETVKKLDRESLRASATLSNPTKASEFFG